MNDIKEKVLELLVRVCSTKKIKKDLNMDLIDKGYLDSMGIVNLLTELEDEFDLEMSLDEFDKECFKTANKIINYVEQSILKNKEK